MHDYTLYMFSVCFITMLLDLEHKPWHNLKSVGDVWFVGKNYQRKAYSSVINFHHDFNSLSSEGRIKIVLSYMKKKIYKCLNISKYNLKYNNKRTMLLLRHCHNIYQYIYVIYKYIRYKKINITNSNYNLNYKQ